MQYKFNKGFKLNPMQILSLGFLLIILIGGIIPMSISYIYVLIDPNTEIVRYVGRTNNPKKRFYRHIYESRKNTNHYARYEEVILEIGEKLWRK